ncbi:hypothetical protein I7I50_00852 [Histoplasma capsulatum G186AR]|uniref:Uncharacterized protein n=1 Tax=Ajellomyces capsulatus TaxID=5037 RepID=A0A8H8D723_AJECA|nr:hypothetical protein I7I52_02229 [Histoplasma capsulatum]QSS72870.1 hypothetical protein I7I50_00852 [Histoplasma capsulatum G186AR]
MLFKNLNFQLHNRSVGRPRPSTYSEYCADLRLLDNDLSQFRAFQNRKGFRRTNAYVPSIRARANGLDPSRECRTPKSSQRLGQGRRRPNRQRSLHTLRQARALRESVPKRGPPESIPRTRECCVVRG